MQITGLIQGRRRPVAQLLLTGALAASALWTSTAFAQASPPPPPRTGAAPDSGERRAPLPPPARARMRQGLQPGMAPDMGPDGAGRRRMGPGEIGPGNMGPGRMGPRNIGPRNMGGRSPGRRKMGGRDMGGRDIGPRNRAGGRGPGGMDGRSERRVASTYLRMRQQLNLTDDQVKRLESLQSASRPQRNDTDMLRARADLMDATRGDGNITAARAALDRMSRLRNDETLAGLKARQDARNVLTAAQKTRLDNMRSRGRSREVEKRSREVEK